MRLRPTSTRPRTYLRFPGFLLLLSLLLACSGPDGNDSRTPTTTRQAGTNATTTSTPPGTDGMATDTPGGVVADTPVPSTPDPAATTPPDAPTAPGSGATPPATSTTTPPDGAPTVTAAAPVDPPYDPGRVSIALQQVGSGFDLPTAVVELPDGSGRMVVLEKTGALRLLDGSLFLDLTGRVVQVGLMGREHEQGLLGVAFHPQFAGNGQFYVHYNDLNGDHIIARYVVGSDGLADPGSEAVLLAYGQPDVNFQGGQLVFGRDGYLYIGTGTGGEAVELQLQAQALDNIYGKILRIDVDTTGPNGEPYGIPPDNPFVSTPGARAEIWAYGLRNPWRFSFDRATNDLYSGGPGQLTRDWINVQPADLPAGQNHGWPIYEGLQCWESWPEACSSEGLLLPVMDFPTYDGGTCVIIGGYVARDAAPLSIHGAYIFGDYCSGRIYATAEQPDGSWLPRQQIGEVGGLMSSFGEDLAGNLYAIDIANGSIYRLVQG